MPTANARRIEPATMHAMAFPRPDATLSPRACELPIPGPGPGQLLVRVHAAGVGHWDRHEVAGTFARRPGLAARFPHVGGSEGAGVVVATGSGVDGFREGDRVVQRRVCREGPVFPIAEAM